MCAYYSFLFIALRKLKKLNLSCCRQLSNKVVPVFKGKEMFNRVATTLAKVGFVEKDPWLVKTGLPHTGKVDEFLRNLKVSEKSWHQKKFQG